jgi:hypothetical protein
MMKPISLRIRAAESNARARQILRRVDEKERLQRRVKWLAMKAVVSIREMRTDATKLNLLNRRAGWSPPKSGPKSDDDWQAEVQRVESILLKISRMGV